MPSSCKPRPAPTTTAPRCAPGDRLRIEHGPFADMEAVFHRFDGQDALVLLNMLHKQHRLTLALKDITTM